MRETTGRWRLIRILLDIIELFILIMWVSAVEPSRMSWTHAIDVSREQVMAEIPSRPPDTW